jgi:hypothetical protein
MQQNQRPKVRVGQKGPKVDIRVESARPQGTKSLCDSCEVWLVLSAYPQG